MATLKDYRKYNTLFYYKNNGKIKLLVSGVQNMDVFGDKADIYFDIIDYAIIDSSVNTLNINYYKYDINSKKIVKRAEDEILEIKQFGKVLTEEERVLNRLHPSFEEIKKAENTIEILSLIQEVI